MQITGTFLIDIDNDSILPKNVITVGSLNKKEKKDLFTSILGQDEKKYDIDYDKCLKVSVR